MVAWIDTLLVHGFGVTEFNENGAAVVFGAAGDDRYRFADGSQPPEVVWSGRMFAARAAGDEAMWGALLDAVTGEDATDASWTRHVLTLLSCAALTFNAVTAGAS